MIAKQIEPPGVDITYNSKGELVRAEREGFSRMYKYEEGELVVSYKNINLEAFKCSEGMLQELEHFLAAIRHLRPGAEEANTESQVSPNDSKDLEEAITLFRDAWAYVPIRLRAAIAKVLEESIENGEAFIKSAREVRGDNV